MQLEQSILKLIDKSHHTRYLGSRDFKYLVGFDFARTLANKLPTHTTAPDILNLAQELYARAKKANEHYVLEREIIAPELPYSLVHCSTSYLEMAIVEFAEQYISFARNNPDMAQEYNAARQRLTLQSAFATRFPLLIDTNLTPQPDSEKKSKDAALFAA